MNITHVTGARPNFPKAAPVIAALKALGINQRLVHTGQHYDDKMSDIFFQELALPRPDINLGVGSGAHGAQTAQTMILLEEEFTSNRPDLVMVYGDINSTVAASLVAAKMHIPTAHVEAGLRSGDRRMPEEINRIVTDQLSDLLFATSPEAIGHLASEGVSVYKVHLVGNPMIDTLLANVDKLSRRSEIDGIAVPDKYAVATMHRPSNVDDPDVAREIIRVFHQVADRIPVFVPLHPRGRARLIEWGFDDHENIHIIDPQGYIDFMSLVRYSSAVITDSGGVQEETTILHVPCLTLRENTERPITITQGSNVLVSTQTLLSELDRVLNSPRSEKVPPLWDGHAGERIAEITQNWLQEHAGN